MQVFTTSKARQNFASILEIATSEGKVLIKRKDGKVFLLSEYKKTENPFCIEGVRTSLSREEIVGCVREGRENNGFS